MFQKLLQPFKYILQVPGKQIRGKLANAFNYWLRVPADKLSVVVDIAQILHNSSLLYVKSSPNLYPPKKLNFLTVNCLLHVLSRLNVN